MPRSVADEQVLAAGVERDEHHLRAGRVARGFDERPSGRECHVLVVVDDVVPQRLFLGDAEVGKLRRVLQRPDLRPGEDCLRRKLREVRRADHPGDVVAVFVREDNRARAPERLVNLLRLLR